MYFRARLVPIIAEIDETGFIQPKKRIKDIRSSLNDGEWLRLMPRQNILVSRLNADAFLIMSFNNKRGTIEFH